MFNGKNIFVKLLFFQDKCYNQGQFQEFPGQWSPCGGLHDILTCLIYSFKFDGIYGTAKLAEII